MSRGRLHGRCTRGGGPPTVETDLARCIGEQRAWVRAGALGADGCGGWRAPAYQGRTGPQGDVDQDEVAEAPAPARRRDRPARRGCTGRVRPAGAWAGSRSRWAAGWAAWSCWWSSCSRSSSAPVAGSASPGAPDLGGAEEAPRGASGPSEEGTRSKYVDAVFDDIQTSGTRTSSAPPDGRYRDTSVVLFTDRTDSGCGVASAGDRSFYAPRTVSCTWTWGSSASSNRVRRPG